MRKTVMIGDIHGCVEEFQALLGQLKFDPAEHQLLLTGDLVGKGPASKEVVQLAARLGARSVRGNHDEAVLRWYRTPPPSRATLPMGEMHRRVAQTLGEEEWAYLCGMPLLLRIPEHNAVVLHGGARPDRPLDAQSERDLLNLRSIKRGGEPSYRVDDGEPWAKLWPGPELLVFGHDARRGLQRYAHAIGLDTGCVYGGQLTALVLPDLRLVSVDAKADYAAKTGDL